MELKTPLTSRKKVTKVLPALTPETPQPLNKPLQEVTVKDEATRSKIKTVTTQRLKRLHVDEAVCTRFFLSQDDYRMLNIVGVMLGVTWDEALRGLIAMHQASADKTSGLQHFIAANN